MKRGIIDRYPLDERGLRVVDIAAQRVSDLYDDFDRNAPFVRKELDVDLVEYLIESGRELGRIPFLINFTLAEPLDEALKERVRSSVPNYFTYLLAKNRRELQAMLRTSFILLAVGAAMLAGSIYLGHAVDDSDPVAWRIVAEGLVIASWVSLWEALAGLLLNWRPTLRERLVYRHLQKAGITFNRSPDAVPG